MLYQQEPIFFVLAFLITIILGFRLTIFLKQYFTQGHAIMVMLAILLNPLSIDALVAPNPLVGSLSFYFFLEALIAHKKGRAYWALGLSLAAGLLNICLTLLPIYFFYQNRKNLKNFFAPLFIYIFFIIIYLWKHILISVHNPISFLSHFILNLVAPLSVSVFDYSIMDFSWSIPVLSVIIVFMILWAQKKNPRSKEFLPFLFLSVIGFQQWAFPYRFWDEIIQSNSNYMMITFAFIVILSIHLPKRYFVLYLACILIISFQWAIQWFPNSNVIRLSIIELPYNKYPLRNEAKRTLAWQLIFEKRDEEGTALLEALSQLEPNNAALKNDLNLIKKFNRDHK